MQACHDAIRCALLNGGVMPEVNDRVARLSATRPTGTGRRALAAGGADSADPSKRLTDEGTSRTPPDRGGPSAKRTARARAYAPGPDSAAGHFEYDKALDFSDTGRCANVGSLGKSSTDVMTSSEQATGVEIRGCAPSVRVRRHLEPRRREHVLKAGISVTT